MIGMSTGTESHGEPPPKLSKRLHQSIADKLAERMVDARLPAGAKLPPLIALAREFGVSTMTVRRALRTLHREGYVDQIAGVGSFVRPKAQAGLRCVAFIGCDLLSPFQLAIAGGAQLAGRQMGWALRLLDGHFDAAVEAAEIHRLPELGVRGALLLPPFIDRRTSTALLGLERQHLPMVMLDAADPVLKLDLVCSDHETGAYLGTRYLLERGHRGVLYLTHPPHTTSVAARIAGYERALTTMGIEPPPDWKAWVDTETHLLGYRTGRKWWGGCQAILPLLQRMEKPLAVLAVDSYVGWGVYEACHELGLRIPEDVSVISFDDVEITHALSPPMTIVSQRTAEIGRIALELLVSRIEGKQAGEAGCRSLRQILVDVDLVERGSVADLRE